MNLIQSTGVVCHESHQELKIQDNESYTEYWCSMSWKSSGTENTRQSFSCIFSSWWLSWHSTPVLCIRFIVLYFQFLMTFMTNYTSTQYKIHCLVFSVPDDFHDKLHQYSVLDSLSCIFSSWRLSWHSTPVLSIRFIVLYFQFLMTLSWKSSGTENTRQWILYRVLV
jgi:hypothetical protein